MESWLPFKQPEIAGSENEPIVRRQVRNRDSEISHVMRKPRQTRLTETQRQSIRRRMKERASLAGASGWLRPFNALINPLLKAMQRVSGFVLWPRDYSGINKGWAGNIDEIPPPLLCFALWLFSNKAADRDDMQQEMCQHETRLVYTCGYVRRTLANTCTVCNVHVQIQKTCVTVDAHEIIHPQPPVTSSVWPHKHRAPRKTSHPLGKR